MLQQQAQEKQIEMENENYQNELDRINKKEIAVINALRNNENATADVNNDGIADALQITSLDDARAKANLDHTAKLKDIQSKDSIAREKLQVEREKLQVDRENQANDLAVAKENAKGRNNKKN